MEPAPPQSPPVREQLTVRCGGESVRISVTSRRSGPGDDLVLMVHGFGCGKESFESAFRSDELARAGLSLVSVDLPGHGDSDRLPTTSDAIEAYAEVVLDLVRQLAPGRLSLVCHSMGCAVGLVASQELGRLGGFVSIEGNLVSQDCGLVSRRAAQLSRARYVDHEYPRFLAELVGSSRPDLRAWATWYEQADPVALHQAAASLVSWSDSGKLLGLLTSIPNSAYVYGTASGDLSYVLDALGPVPAFPITGSGHFPMVDNPTALWRVVATVLAN